MNARMIAKVTQQDKLEIEVMVDGEPVASGIVTAVLADNIARMINGQHLVMCHICRDQAAMQLDQYADGEFATCVECKR